jgi:hypothetical protein
VKTQIDGYISSQAEAKRDELQDLHQRILGMAPGCKLWFLDGRNSEGKVVTNPNIGYGSAPITYVNGEIREFYRIGLSANTAGISVYVMGLDDKKHLAETYAARLGKAKVTGYCIKFRRLADIDRNVLDELIADSIGAATADLA